MSQAGETIGEIVQAVTSVTYIMGEIASASDEQSRGISQVSQAVSEMDSAVQQNAALVQEASAAAVSLEDQAGRLTQAVAVFQIASPASPRALAASTGAAVPTSVQSKPALPAAGTKRVKPDYNQNWESFDRY